MKEYEIVKINEDTYAVENNDVRFFILTGKEKALLIDSGMTVRNAKEIANELTALPIELINTHADIDHIGSNHEFAAPYMHPSELSNYHNTKKFSGDITPLWDGDTINLGDRELKIIHIPGHTPGSIAILDVRSRMLFSGDPVQDGAIFMFGVQRDMDAYIHSLKRLDKMKDEFDYIYPSHGSYPLKPEIIEKLIEAAEKVRNNEIELRQSDFMGTPVSFYDAGCAIFLCDNK